MTEILFDLTPLFIGIGILVFRKSILDNWKQWFLQLPWMDYTPEKERLAAFNLWTFGVIIIVGGLYHLITVLLK